MLDAAGDVAIISAGVAGLMYLLRLVYKARKPTLRLFRGIEQLVAIGDTTEWPNGSTDLPSSLTEIYKRQQINTLQLQDVQKDLELLLNGDRYE